MASMPGREFKSEQNRVCLFFMASMPGRRGLRACTARNPNFNLYRPHEACIMAYSGSARDVRRQMYCEGERGEEEGKKEKRNLYVGSRKIWVKEELGSGGKIIGCKPHKIRGFDCLQI